MNQRQFMTVVLLCLFALSSWAIASPGDDHRPMHEHGHGHGTHMGMGMGAHGGGHMFGAPWMATLTPEQRAKIDALHLQLAKKQAPLEAKKHALKVELKLLILTDKPDRKAIDKKIDELVTVKSRFMRNKIGHKIDMRALLTDEQRVSFDLGMMRKYGHGKPHGGRH